jgi:hypothetical protein
MLSPVPGGWIGATDPETAAMLSAVLSRYLAAETAAAARCDAIRRGEIPPDPPAGRWIVSDRD